MGAQQLASAPAAVRLALYGDLTPVLAGQGPITLRHRLESLKLIERHKPHGKELYGAVTIEGVSRLEVRPHDRRVFCMAVTTDGKDRGRPSSWSAALDNLAAGAINDTRRLLVVSAGNTTDNANYPDDNESSSVQDPAQSWNALTVGGTTDKAFIDQQQNPGLDRPCPTGRYRSREHDLAHLAPFPPLAVQARHRHGSQQYGPLPQLRPHVPA
jgi:hypothetical protein